MHLLLIRHGESECNVKGLIGGPKGDTGLTKVGRDQAKAMGKYLREYLKGKTVSFFSSLLPRATETAQIIAGIIDYENEIITDEYLTELNPGELDGLTWGEYLAKYEPFNFADHPFRKVSKSGESWAGFLSRAVKGLENVIQNSRSENVVVVSHGGVIQASMIKWLSLKRYGTKAGLNPRYASLTEWAVDGSFKRLLRYNFSADYL